MQIKRTSIQKTTKRPQLPGAKNLVFPDQPVPRLPRPLLIVPGGNARPWSLPHLLHYLCHGEENVYAGSVRPERLEHFREQHAEHGGNIFSVYFSRRFGSVEENSKELQQVIETIREVTGAEEIDVVAECKGALETRKHLQDLGDGVRNLVQVVPPNRGMPVTGDLASVVASVAEGLGLGIDRLGFFEIKPENLDTFQDMRTQMGLGPLQWNPTLKEMNRPEALQREKDALHSNTILMGLGHKSLMLPKPLLKGDGTITAWSAAQPGATHFGYSGEGTDHGRLVTHPDAMAKIAETLLTDGDPDKDANYLEDLPSPGLASTGLILQGASLAGQVAVLRSAFAGTQLGPVGAALMGASAVSAGTDMVHALTAEHSRQQTLGRALQFTASLAQFAGLGLAGHNKPGLATAVLAGSQLLHAVAQ